LGTGEATVGELVERLGLSQPQVSKHLGVLRAVGVVLACADGRHRWYRVNGPALKPIHDWVQPFEHTWNTRLDRLDDLLAELQPEETQRSRARTSGTAKRSRPKKRRRSEAVLGRAGRRSEVDQRSRRTHHEQP
jgi:DNA-binding transcriptional ArsR family regulator